MYCNGGNKSHYKHSPHRYSKSSLNFMGVLKLNSRLPYLSILTKIIYPINLSFTSFVFLPPFHILK